MPTTFSNHSFHSEYDGTDDIAMDNGNKLPITRTSSTQITFPSRNFLLSDILCVPIMKHNLLYVSKFCITNHAFVEFSPHGFAVEDLWMGLLLHSSLLIGEAYE